MCGSRPEADVRGTARLWRKTGAQVTYLGLLLLAIANAVGLIFLSFLAAGGDGSADGVRAIWRWGFGWIALNSLFAVALCAKGKRTLGVLVAAATLPVGYVATVLVYGVKTGYESSLASNSPEFAAVCRTAGPTFLAQPNLPVRSIAYDWTDTHPPLINFFVAASNGHLKELRGGLGLAAYPAQIKFTESRCCRFEGRPTNGVGPFIRRPNSDAEYFGVTELTADVLVRIEQRAIGPQDATNNLVRVDLSVVDRRDGQRLATLRYAVDQRKRRGCGTTSGDVMDERAFVLQAVGVN